MPPFLMSYWYLFLILLNLTYCLPCCCFIFSKIVLFYVAQIVCCEFHTNTKRSKGGYVYKTDNKFIFYRPNKSAYMKSIFSSNYETKCTTV